MQPRISPRGGGGWSTWGSRSLQHKGREVQEGEAKSAHQAITGEILIWNGRPGSGVAGVLRGRQRGAIARIR